MATEAEEARLRSRADRNSLEQRLLGWAEVLSVRDVDTYTRAPYATVDGAALSTWRDTVVVQNNVSAQLTYERGLLQAVESATSDTSVAPALWRSTQLPDAALLRDSVASQQELEGVLDELRTSAWSDATTNRKEQVVDQLLPMELVATQAYESRSLGLRDGRRSCPTSGRLLTCQEFVDIHGVRGEIDCQILLSTVASFEQYCSVHVNTLSNVTNLRR